VIAAVDAFGEAISASDRVHRFDLARGDLVVVDNRRCLHGRTAVDEPQHSQRLLLRTKVMAE
jgi:alpha-ketoglutarate-dependent taurine dioxygenase